MIELSKNGVYLVIFPLCAGIEFLSLEIWNSFEQTVQRILSEQMGNKIGKVILVNEIDPGILDFARQILNRNKIDR